jgi:hypothetical protein
MPVDLDSCCTLRAEGVDSSKQLFWDASYFYPLKKPFLVDPVVGAFHVEANQAYYSSTSPYSIDLFLEE